MKRIVIIVAILLSCGVESYSQQHREADLDATKNILIDEGSFFLSCNYWSSNAGTAMWKNWDIEVIENDLKKLKAAGITTLRVFPNWEDFQPIRAARNARSEIIDYRMGDQDMPLGDDKYGRAGVSKVMVDRMREFLSLGEEYGMKFIVSLLTGHMSGRVFLPPAIQGLNPLSDPLAIQWETRFVEFMVSEFKDCEAIVGWGLGNETNNMGSVSRQEAWVWSSLIANAIKKCDSTRPVLSDNHGLSPEGTWSILDQGEVTDILTTHPYPLFTANCGNEPINTIRPIIHGAAESKYYGGLSGRPVIVEEMGSLGNMISSESVQADFYRAATFSALANGCKSSMWWCNSDFSHLNHPPYDWQPFETELGMFRSDGTPKPIVEEMTKFYNFYSKFPYENALPNPKDDVVCILTKGQSNWSVAQTSFILGKMANVNIDYQYASQPLKESQYYMLPSLNGFYAITKHRLEELLSRVEQGATLYVSMGDTYISGFEEMTGIRVKRRAGASRSVVATVGGADLHFGCSVTYEFENCGAEVLIQSKDGYPLLVQNNYGKGKVILLTANLEQSLASDSRAYLAPNQYPYWKLYGEIFGVERVVRKSEPLLGLTEHFVSDNKCVVVVLNYSDEDLSDTLELAEGWKLVKSYYGAKPNKSLEVNVKANDAIVLEFSK